MRGMQKTIQIFLAVNLLFAFGYRDERSTRCFWVSKEPSRPFREVIVSVRARELGKRQ